MVGCYSHGASQEAALRQTPLPGGRVWAGYDVVQLLISSLKLREKGRKVIKIISSNLKNEKRDL